MSRRRASSRSLFGAAVAAAVLVAACSSGPRPTPNPQRQAADSLTQGAARALARKDYAAALRQYEGALAAAESIEDFERAGSALLNLALVHSRMGQLSAAHARVDRILAVPARYGATLHAQAAARKALLEVDAPDLDAALRWTDVAQSVCAEPCVVGATLADIRAHVALERSDPAAAAGHAARAVALATGGGLEAERGNALRLLGRAQTRLGQTTEAAQSLASALDIDRTLGLPERVALDLVYAAENEERRSQAALAREYYERAIAVYVAAGNAKAADLVRARLGRTAAAAAAMQ